jgi:hypothetical protein
VEGEVDDYTDEVQDALRAGIAAEVGVAADAVTLTVEAASVRLTFEVALPASGDLDATTVASALATLLADPEAATTFLNSALTDAGVSGLTLAVESIAVAPIAIEAAAIEADPEEEATLSAGAIAGIAACGLVGVGALGCMLIYALKLRMKSSVPKFTKSRVHPGRSRIDFVGDTSC